jgi:hypothetical protein
MGMIGNAQEFCQTLTPYRLRISLPGWGEKIALFWTTDQESRAICDILSGVLREGVRSDVVQIGPQVERLQAKQAAKLT